LQLETVAAHMTAGSLPAIRFASIERRNGLRHCKATATLAHIRLNGKGPLEIEKGGI
jgi:hypothetical protein